MKDNTFKGELTDLLNRHSIENKSYTPDYILADYLIRCLSVWEESTADRDRWWRHKPRQKEMDVTQCGDKEQRTTETLEKYITDASGRRVEVTTMGDIIDTERKR